MTITVLLVGENHTVRKELHALLQRCSDLELFSEVDSRGAMQLLQRTTTVDVIVLDTQPPFRNGLNTAGAMKSCAAGPPVILLSLHTDARYVQASFSEGIAGYLLREDAYEELPDAIRAVAGGRCYVSPQIMEALPDGFVEENCRLNKAP